MSSPKLFQLMVIIALLAIGFAALCSGSQLWLKLVYNIAFVSLLYASLRAKNCAGAKGSYWFGVALFGWAAFFAGLNRLPISLNEYVGISDLAAVVAQIFVRPISTGNPGESRALYRLSLQSSSIIAYFLLCALLAQACGIVSKFLYMKNQPERGSPIRDPSS